MHDVTSAEVEACLHHVVGEEISAKDVRTWAGTAPAATTLLQIEAASSTTAAKRKLSAAIREFAGRLGNTPAF